MTPSELAAALRTLGLLYGAGPLHEALEAVDPPDAVRAYLRRERPHLLLSYDLETLVDMVLEARASGAEAPASIECHRAP